eukprot:COSAG04_NODE_224_length_19624_cov_47.932855_14_plen_138_part_00
MSHSSGGKGAEQQQHKEQEEGQQEGQPGGGGKTVEWAIFKHPAVLSLMTFQWASDNTEFTLRSLGPIFFMESFGISVRKTQHDPDHDHLLRIRCQGTGPFGLRRRSPVAHLERLSGASLASFCTSLECIGAANIRPD